MSDNIFHYLGMVDKQEISHDKKTVRVYIMSGNGSMVLNMSKEQAAAFIPGTQVDATVKP